MNIFEQVEKYKLENEMLKDENKALKKENKEQAKKIESYSKRLAAKDSKLSSNLIQCKMLKEQYEQAISEARQAELIYRQAHDECLRLRAMFG